MRASRAYIAGFGTAGSLLAGAAMVFVLASAVVAFRGWPQLGVQATPIAVVAQQPQAPLDVRAVRKLVAADAAAASPSATGPATAHGAAATASSQPVSTHVGARTQPNSTDHQNTQHFVQKTSTGTPPSTKPKACAGACGLTTVVGGTVNHVTGALGSTLASAGNAVASTVTGLTNTLANTLSGLSPALGKTVKQAGDALGATLTGATGAVGGLLTGTGKALAQLLGGHATGH